MAMWEIRLFIGKLYNVEFGKKYDQKKVRYNRAALLTVQLERSGDCPEERSDGGNAHSACTLPR